MTTMTTSVNIGKKPAPVTLSDIAITKVAELLAQAAAQCCEFGAQPVVGGFGVDQVSSQRRGGHVAAGGSSATVMVGDLGCCSFGLGA